MKKILIPILSLTIGQLISAQNFAEHCHDTLTPSFAERLGTVSFASDREWTVTGNGITQIWSDAVQATGCDKTNFSGDSSFVFLTDCRSNPGHAGSLFSWCAVARFADTLCPAPWRVPTVEDFCNLNSILFETATCRTHTVTPEKMLETFVDIWGGNFGGGSGSRGTLYFSDVKAYYWSQSVHDLHHAFHSTFDIHGNVDPRCIVNAKALGFSLRCVR